MFSNLYFLLRCQRLSKKSASGLPFPSIMMLICPASNGEQAITSIGRQLKQLQQHVGIAGKGQGLRCGRQACCDGPIRVITA